MKKYSLILLIFSFFFQSAMAQDAVSILKKADLVIPEVSDIAISYGGRRGIHTEYLKPLLDEMTEVYNIDPQAEW